MEEVQGLEDTVYGIGGFGSTGVNEKNDTEVKKEMKGENEQSEKKAEEIKTETLKGSSSGRQRTEMNRKTTEGLFRLSQE